MAERHSEVRVCEDGRKRLRAEEACVMDIERHMDDTVSYVTETDANVLRCF